MVGEYIMIGDLVESVRSPGVVGMVVKVLYGDDDPALILITNPTPRGSAKQPVIKQSLKYWKKVDSLRGYM